MGKSEHYKSIDKQVEKLDELIAKRNKLWSELKAAIEKEKENV